MNWVEVGRAQKAEWGRGGGNESGIRRYLGASAQAGRPAPLGLCGERGRLDVRFRRAIRQFALRTVDPGGAKVRGTLAATVDYGLGKSEPRLSSAGFQDSLAASYRGIGSRGTVYSK